MNTRRPALATCVLAVGIAAGFSRPVLAQGHTPDPYNIVGEYNRQYEPYMYATVPTEPGTLPNQDRLEARSGLRNANRFQNFLQGDEEESEDFGRGPSPSARLAGPGVPYYRANRQYDREFQRNYRPNDLADRSFYSSQQLRNDKYFQALRQTDPRKRAQLLREYNLENLRAARTLSANRSMSERERERDASRDRFGPGGLPLNLDDDPDGRSPGGAAAAAPRRPAATPSVPGEGSSLLTPGAPVPLRNRARPNNSTAPPRPGTPRVRPSPSSPRGTTPSEILQRSDLLDRASRAVRSGASALPATVPTAPLSPSPR